MAGIALVLDLLKRKNICVGGHCVRSYDLFSATAAASAVASSFAVTGPFATRALFGKRGFIPVAYCDAGAGASATLPEDNVSSIEPPKSIFEEEPPKSIFEEELPESIFEPEPVYFSVKTYNIELKPLLSAFHWKNFALTSLRSFLLFYLPLLEPNASLDEDDDDFLPDSNEEQRPDLIVPLKKSLAQIVRDCVVVTTRRILERFAVQYSSQRLAWKLLKDAPTSATRKAARSMPTLTYIHCVSRTTFRAQFLGILASWLVQVGIDVYRVFSRMFVDSDEEEVDQVVRVHQIRQLGGRIYLTTLRCGASLVFASIGAGIGAVLFRPSTGQWIGSAIGDLTGPVIVSYCLRGAFNLDL